MAVLTRSALEGSPLADLHALATELGLDGFRRLRKADLVDAILARQDGGEDGVTDEDAGEEQPAPARRSRGARGGRTRRTRDADADEDGDAAEPDVDAVADAEEAETEAEAEDKPARSRRSREPRGGRGGREPREDRSGRGGREPREDRGGRGGREPREERGGREDRGGREPREDRIAEGVVELADNGSGFLRVSPPEPSDDDVYISAAQVRRCELVGGDTIAGPVRAPRRSERYPSLIRIDTINGKPADEVAEGTHFEDLPATWPTVRFELGAEDPTLNAIDRLAPIGRGSRVTITGGAYAGKSEALRRLAGALVAVEGLETSVVLAGVRPEETSGWPVEPVAALSFAAGVDAQSQAIERALDTAKRIAARGADAVVLIDSLDGVDARAARRALAAARNIADGGSLTVIATSTVPVGGETTVVALDPQLTRAGRFPALDLARSGTLHADELVGDAGANAIAQERGAAG